MLLRNSVHAEYPRLNHDIILNSALSAKIWHGPENWSMGSVTIEAGVSRNNSGE